MQAQINQHAASRWPLVRLGDVCEIIGGGTPSKEKPEFYNGDIRWATVRDMRNDVIEDTENKITAAAVKASATHIIPAGNVIIATRVGLGKTCLLAGDTAINQDLRGIVPAKTHTIVPKYLFYWFKSIAHKIIAEGTGATVQGVKVGFVQSLLLPLPPIAEQQRIVARLDAAFAAIAEATAAAEANLRNARALFDSYLNQVFSQRGPGWVECGKTLDEMCELIVDCEHKTAPTQDTGYPSVRTPNIGKGNLIFENMNYVSRDVYEEWTRRAIPRAGDLILAREAPAGNVAVIPENTEVCLGQRTVLLRVKTSYFSPHFLAFLLLSPLMQLKLLAHSRGATVQHVNLKDIRALTFDFIPSIEIQSGIVQDILYVFEQSETIVELFQQKINALTELKQSLLAEAFGEG